MKQAMEMLKNLGGLIKNAQGGLQNMEALGEMMKQQFQQQQQPQPAPEQEPEQEE